MKTAIETAETEIAELWSSPSDLPTYTQIFDVLERAKEKEKQQIIDARIDGVAKSLTLKTNAIDRKPSEQYYTSTFETNKETLK